MIIRPNGCKALLALSFALVLTYGTFRFFAGFHSGAGMAGPVEIRTDPGLRVNGAEGEASIEAETESPYPGLSPLWSVKAQGPCFLALAGDMLLAASTGGEVTALNAEKGTPVWRYDAGGRITSSPVSAEGKIFFGSSNGVIRSIDAATGVVDWSFDAGGEALSAPTFCGGRLYVTVDMGMTSAIHCLDAGSGRRIWSHHSEGWVAGPPACGSKSLHFGTYNREAVGLNMVTGKQAWAMDAGRVIFASPLVYGGVAYYVSIDGSVRALRADEGTLLWERSLREFVWQAPLLVGDSLLLATYERSVYALGRRDGEVLWRVRLEQPVDLPLRADSEAVYAFTSTGNIHRIGLTGGDRLGSWRLEEAPWTAPLLAGGRIFTSSRDGRIRAYPKPPEAAAKTTAGE